MIDPDKKPKRPWYSFGVLVLMVLALIAAWCFLLPLGLEVRHVFQILTDAFSHRQ